MDITFEVRTNAGIFYKMFPFESGFLDLSESERLLLYYHGQHFSADIETALYWDPSGFDYDYMLEQVAKGQHDKDITYKPFLFSKNPSFIDVILRANDLIIGYAVIEIREVSGKTDYLAEEFSFELLTAVSFPQVDGNWQNVTLKYVQEQINKIHTEREALS